MNGRGYKYDVAFSFLAKDEALATELSDLIQERVQTFLYSKKQGEIAGTDGEKTFNAVFGEEARLVVVLYRAGWGETPWTRIEETAIRNRAFEQGYEFVKLIPLDDPPSAPKWLPKTQLWVGLKRWGTSGAASVIEARIEELGGQPHEETVAERAVRLERSLKFSEKKTRFLNSGEGVKAANEEFGILHREIEHLIAEIKQSASSLSFTLKHRERQFVILGPNSALSVGWQYHYANSLEKAQLSVSVWRGHPPFPGVVTFDEPSRLRENHFTFDLLPNEQCRWMSSDSGGRHFTSKELASFVLKYAMDHPYR
jgi:hypothetical protein